MAHDLKRKRGVEWNKDEQRLYGCKRAKNRTSPRKPVRAKLPLKTRSRAKVQVQPRKRYAASIEWLPKVAMHTTVKNGTLRAGMQKVKPRSANVMYPRREKITIYNTPLNLGVGEVWAMASRSEKNVARFVVQLGDGGWMCSCPAATASPPRMCYHIKEIQRAKQ